MVYSLPTHPPPDVPSTPVSTHSPTWSKKAYHAGSHQAVIMISNLSSNGTASSSKCDESTGALSMQRKAGDRGLNSEGMHDDGDASGLHHHHHTGHSDNESHDPFSSSSAPPRQNVLPPSPPLTRVGTNESSRMRKRLSGAQQDTHRNLPLNSELNHTVANAGVAVVSAAGATGNSSSSGAGDAMQAGAEGDASYQDESISGHSVDLAFADGARIRGLGTEENYSDDGAGHNGVPSTSSHNHTPYNAAKWTTANDHPLKSSPDPWNVIEPPPSNNHHLSPSPSLSTSKDPYSSISRAKMTTASGINQPSSSKRRIPRSSYYYGPPPADSAFGTNPCGQIGVHHPREIVRIERDYSTGEIPQFSLAYPLELEGRLTPKEFLESINVINERLYSAHDLTWSCLDNTIAVLSLYISRFVVRSHYDREMRRLHKHVQELNRQLFNPVGLNVVWPKDIAFLFLEIEYY